nr:reverse transcriptase domain-containing protein [Tanacetum cinerariifolium]
MDVLKKESSGKQDKYIEEIVNLEKKKKALDNIIYKTGQTVQTMHMLTKPQVFYDNTHKIALGYQNPLYLCKAQRIQLVLYSDSALAEKHDAISVIDTEKTLRTRSTEISNGLAAIQAQLNNLGGEIKKGNENVTPPKILRNGISNFEQKFGESFHEAWDRYKDLLRACPHHGFTELYPLNTFYNALNHTDQDSLNAAASGNLLERSTQDVLMIIKNKLKVRNSRRKSIASQVKAYDTNSSFEMAKLTHAVNEQTSTCLAASGKTFPEFRDNIQEYIFAAATNYNQGNPGYRPQGIVNQMRPPGFA